MIFEGSAITVQLLDDDIAELKFDLKNESVNKFSADVVKELSDAITAIESEQRVKGVIATSAKDVFIVGADITQFGGVFEAGADAIAAMLGDNNRNNNRLEDLRVPVVAAVNGFALGGGLEFALACDYRVASTQAKLGVPETKLGLIPGWGGTVRLPRIAGVDTAVTWIATGKDHRADDALKFGVVDAVVEPDQLRDAALYTVKQCIAGKLDYEARRKQKRSPLPLNMIETMMAFETSKAFIKATAGPNYPAPVEAAKAMQKASSLDREAALKIESETFAKLAQGSVARALVSIFLNDQLLGKRSKQWASKADKKVERAAVLGAGIMGGGIAYQSALKGTPILMKDINQAGLDLGLSEARKLLLKRVDKGRMTPAKMGEVLNNIDPTLDYGGFDQVDVVVEAVVENPKAKHAVLSEVEGKVTDDTILASNTSTISIDFLAKALQRPENFCGMHFFNPVHAMPLVEVIRGSKTSDKAVARTVAYASAMGKKPVVVRDCPGFLVNRVLFPYFAGFSMLVRDGADFQQIDKIMEKWGWPMGPAYLLDVVGLDTAVHAAGVMAEGFPERMNRTFKDSIEVLFEADRLGQKNGKGFYEYTTDKKGKPKKVTSEAAYELIKPHTAERREFSDEEIIERMMVPMATELARCVDEGIVESPAEADMALIYGIGFPPFRGGLFAWIDSIGAKTIVEMADKHKSLGGVYEATDSMRKMAADDKKYFG
ncbi:fatty acid oxidation complex subunit alpha FadB [Gilvimarinus sp. F26214L]|uniref:fatty acid oxidation complex subunit alpha FadB n=1 Tax=Gilvimarinus sp. DZF01 TaxID=3461371 RepID=UPI004045E973